MVIFHSYVSLPEGKKYDLGLRSWLKKPPNLALSHNFGENLSPMKKK